MTRTTFALLGLVLALAELAACVSTPPPATAVRVLGPAPDLAGHVAYCAADPAGFGC